MYCTRSIFEWMCPLYIDICRIFLHHLTPCTITQFIVVFYRYLLGILFQYSSLKKMHSFFKILELERFNPKLLICSLKLCSVFIYQNFKYLVIALKSTLTISHNNWGLIYYLTRSLSLHIVFLEHHLIRCFLPRVVMFFANRQMLNRNL